MKIYLQDSASGEVIVAEATSSSQLEAEFADGELVIVVKAATGQRREMWRDEAGVTYYRRNATDAR